MEPITEEDFASWLGNAVTKRFMHRIKSDIEELKTLSMGVSPEDLLELQGRYKVAMSILNIEYTDL